MIVGEEFVVEMKGANTRIMLTAFGSVEFDAVASLLEGWRGKGGRGVKKIKKNKEKVKENRRNDYQTENDPYYCRIRRVVRVIDTVSE